MSAPSKASLATAFALSTAVAIPLSIRSSQGSTPPWFPVVVKSPNGGAALIRFDKLELDNQPPGDRFLLSPGEITELNRSLARESSLRGEHWEVSVLEQQVGRQYLHVHLAGDDDVIESWYCATRVGIEPAHHRWLDPGVLVIACPLTLLIAAGIFGAGWRFGQVVRRRQAN